MRLPGATAATTRPAKYRIAFDAVFGAVAKLFHHPFPPAVHSQYHPDLCRQIFDGAASRHTRFTDPFVFLHKFPNPGFPVQAICDRRNVCLAGDCL